MTRGRRVSVCLCWALSLLALIGKPIGAGAQMPAADSIALTVSDETALDLQGFRLFSGGFRCDSAGNVYTIPILAGAQISPARILRMSSKDGVSSRISVSAALRAHDPDIIMHFVALDTRGRLHALVAVNAPSGAYDSIVSFDDEGRLAGKLDLDTDDLAAYRVAVFDSGDVLVVGQRRLIPEGRVAVMPSGGGPLRDVAAPADVGPPSGQGTAAWPAPSREASFAEPAPDGRVYFALAAGPVYAITPAGQISGTIRLTPPHAAGSLIDVQVSGGRLAAIYHVRELAGTPKWITVHDLVTGERVATYGPVKGAVMCYRPEGSRDRFALLRSRAGRFLFMTASPP